MGAKTDHGAVLAVKDKCIAAEPDMEDFDDMDPKADGFEGKILAHPLMQSELARQRSDVELLAATPMSEAFAQRLLSEWRSLAKGNIELSG